MSLVTIMDWIATTAAAGLAANDPTTGLPGLKACYSAGATNEALIIPETFDDSPIGIVGFADGKLDPSNYEETVHQLELVIWTHAVNITWAFRTMAPFFDRAKVLFRSDLDAGGNAVRVIVTGYSRVQEDDTHDKPFLLWPIRLEAYELEVGAALYST